MRIAAARKTKSPKVLIRLVADSLHEGSINE
jgi:hypothetical protein